MRSGARGLLGAGMGAVVFGALAYPSRWLMLLCVREALKLFEVVGIMDPKGDLGGQIMGFNFQRHPEWAHWLAGGVAAVLGYGVAVVVSIVVMRRVSGGWRATLCGRCGGEVRGAVELRCARCGGEF